ncbi:MAG: sugar phosphate isomerase/epimerase [Lewinellaceae bacterium]|nr:sugar phosphate isomerase/epimerase [Phaeodactylibacter sp.]MCB0614571.1 sugar phosphate isomerase/epimerase [Phaeodactylibacter sp.]MCB9347352.1 sugar phosphate isomerase/epimerase [Lewinellaceae bacterium]
MQKSRRTFIRESGLIVAGLSLYGLSACSNENQSDVENVEIPEGLFFNISLAQWSLHKALKSGKMDNLDFAAMAKKDFGIHAVEYVSQFFQDKAKDKAYLAEMKKRADDNGVKSLLIMIDNEGDLGSTDEEARAQAVANHYQWLDAAKFLGCHSIRVNAAGQGEPGDVAQAAVRSLQQLGEYAGQLELNVLVENHGGYSSDGQWLSLIMKALNRPNVGTLPDFGNFCLEKDKDGKCIKEYNRYDGLHDLLPFAKGVSAKSYAFDEQGKETTIDYGKMLKLVKEAGYTGHIGIEFEGEDSEANGILATKRLLVEEGMKLS